MKNQAVVLGNGSDVIHGTFVDRCEWVYWDTIYAACGVDSWHVDPFNPFSIPMGRVDPVLGKSKTLHDTNLFTSGPAQGFGATRCLIMQEMGIYFPLWLSNADIDLLLSRATLVFSIAEKVFYESRFDFREDARRDEPIINTYVGGEQEVFEPAQLSGRMVRIKVKDDQFAKYIAPIVPFAWRITLSDGDPLIFEGVKPIMIPTMTGWTDRPVQ